MLRITQCKAKIEYSESDLYQLVSKKIGIKKEDIESVRLVKRSLDARKKPDLFYSLTLDVKVKNEAQILKRCKNNRDIIAFTQKDYQFPYSMYDMVTNRDKQAYRRPLIVGAGPAGLVCAYFLALNGFRPILIERGKCVEQRISDVEKFWESGKLLLNSNVQFGEGGAGTFSDGKLNTLIKDKNGRCKAVLKLFHEMGAPESILYDQKPHVGTDLLINMVSNLRNEIIRLGGEIRFETQLTDLVIENGKIEEAITDLNESIMVDHLVLAIGHSARDTFELLVDKKLELLPKSFAVGFRVQHSQKLINESQYGIQDEKILQSLGAANYKLTAKAKNGRGVYTFCMCPGGYVVNASSEQGRLAVNGMSYHDRDSGVANSAVIITVDPQDFNPGEKIEPLSGVYFQRKLEEKAFELGNGRVPIQYLGDFRKNLEADFCKKDNDIQSNAAAKRFEPIRIKGGFEFANLRSLFPDDINEAFLDGMDQFDRKIQGFGSDDTVLAGVESRTSSPVRISRDEEGQSCIRGIYPCGEGAGYAGGITSAAMDGIYIAELVAKHMLEEIKGISNTL